MRSHVLRGLDFAAGVTASGAVARVLTYPRDEVALRRKSEPIAEEEYGTEELWALAETLADTMKAHRGLGLSAIQIGVAKRMFVVAAGAFGALRPGVDPGDAVVFCNPAVTVDERRGWERGSEGCLSFPGAFEMLDGPKRVHVTARDAQGAEIDGPLVGLVARCAWHESKHLDGELIVDRMSSIARRAFLAAVKGGARG